MYIIYGIYFGLLFLVPIGLSIILNCKNHNSNIKTILENCKYMFKFIKVICIALIFIFFVKMFILGVVNVNIWLLDVFYFTILVGMIVFINYFSTKYFKFKQCIMIFLDKTLDFIKDNFILNLLFVVLIIFIKRYHNLTIGIIGSYAFFALTSIHQEYKKCVNENNKEFKGLYVVIQTLLNISLVCSFSTIERIIAGFSKKVMINIEGKDIICSMLLIVMIVINSFLPETESFLKKIKYSIKEKIIL